MPQACRRNCLSNTADLKIIQNDGKTIPQSLSRQLPLHKGAFLLKVRGSTLWSHTVDPHMGPIEVWRYAGGSLYY